MIEVAVLVLSCAVGAVAVLAVCYAVVVGRVLPDRFRRGQVRQVAEAQHWEYTVGQPQDEPDGCSPFVELELTGKFRGRPFRATQTRAVPDEASGAGGSASKATHRNRATELTLSAVDQFPEGHIRLHRMRGTVSVREPDNRGLAEALAGSDFERWLSARRVRGGSLTVDDRTIGTRWAGGIYRARLLRKLDFLHEAAQHLSRTLDDVDPDWRVNRLPGDARHSGQSRDRKE